MLEPARGLSSLVLNKRIVGYGMRMGVADGTTFGLWSVTMIRTHGPGRHPTQDPVGFNRILQDPIGSCRILLGSY